MPGNRSIQNIFVRPRFQYRLIFIPAGMSIAILSVVALLIFNRLSQIQQLINNNPRIDFVIQSQINELMLSCLQYALFGFMLSIILVFIFNLMMSHRVAGPQVAIVSALKAIQQGDYSPPRPLRPTDELQEVMSEIRELADELDQRR
jgi:HAMP domain-containing protein